MLFALGSVLSGSIETRSNGDPTMTRSATNVRDEGKKKTYFSINWNILPGDAEWHDDRNTK